MALGLVGRGVRALSDHINLFYRVFKGIDPDSLFVRLATGGSFEVRHSASNLPVFKVTDAGANGQVTIPPGSIGSTELADGSVTNADVNANAGIVVSKLAGPGAGQTNRVLRTTDGVTPLWGTVLNLDVTPNTLAPDRLAGPGAGQTNRVLRTTDGVTPLWGTIQNLDVTPNALAPDRLAGPGAGQTNRVLRTTDGVTPLWGTVQFNDITPQNVGASHLVGGGTANQLLRTTDGTAVSWGVPNTTMLGGSGAASTVLRTNDGVNPLFGKVQTADLAPNAAGQIQAALGGTQSTTSGSMVALPGASLTVAATGKPLVFCLHLTNLGCTVAGAIAVELWEGAPVNGVISGLAYDNVQAGIYVSRALTLALTPTAGSHSYFIQWKTPGSGTLQCTNFNFWVVDLRSS